MNKKLIAIAIAGAMAAPFAANAGEATLYGKMHVSVDQFDNDNSNAAEDSGTGLSSNSSRWGIKGAEDLGGGMKAIWQVETGVNLTDGNGGGNMANRNSFAGLAGGFGTALVGRHDTPYKIVGRKADLFGDTVGDSRTLINTAQGATGHDLRPNNVIAYATPNMGGFSAMAAYVSDWNGDTTDDNETDAYSINVAYSAGPLWVGFGTQEISMNAAGVEDPSANRLAASYKLGAAKLTALWQETEDNGGTDGADQTTWGIGGAYTMGNNTLKAQYYVADEMDNTNDTGSSKVAVGIDHAMSKQTSVYAMYAAVDNDDAASVNVVTSGHGDAGPAGGPELGGDPSAFSVGLVHKF